MQPKRPDPVVRLLPAVDSPWLAQATTGSNWRLRPSEALLPGGGIIRAMGHRQRADPRHVESAHDTQAIGVAADMLEGVDHDAPNAAVAELGPIIGRPARLIKPAAVV